MSAMRLGATLNGFTVVTPPTNDGAGMSEWCHVERDGERFFMKRYLAPKYPTPSAPGTPEGKERRRQECEQFEHRHLTIAHRLKGDAPGGGHLVTTLAFFRVGPAYYKVTRLVDVDHRVNLIEQDPETRSIALRSLLFSVRLLHDQGIVHGDLKPDNVLFQRTAAGAVTSKLIDFDEAYLSGEPPDVMHIVGDPLYYSPEMFAYVKQDPSITGADLTLGSDIFSLGVLIHVLLTGDLPYFDSTRWGYPAEAAAAGEHLTLRETLPVGTIRQMLTAMLNADPTARPDINAVIAAFRADDLRAAAEGAMPELTRAEVVAMRRLRERAAFGSFSGSPAADGDPTTTPADHPPDVDRGEPEISSDVEKPVAEDTAGPTPSTASDPSTAPDPSPRRSPTELWAVPTRAAPAPSDAGGVPKVRVEPKGGSRTLAPLARVDDDLHPTSTEDRPAEPTSPASPPTDAEPDSTGGGRIRSTFNQAEDDGEGDG